MWMKQMHHQWQNEITSGEQIGENLQNDLTTRLIKWKHSEKAADFMYLEENIVQIQKKNIKLGCLSTLSKKTKPLVLDLQCFQVQVLQSCLSGFITGWCRSTPRSLCLWWPRDRQEIMGSWMVSLLYLCFGDTMRYTFP